MVSTLAFVGLAVTLRARLHPVVASSTGIVGFLAGAIGEPLLLYDAHAIRDTLAAGGSRLDPFWTVFALVLIYPLGLPIDLITRMNGAYVGATDVDPGGWTWATSLRSGCRFSSTRPPGGRAGRLAVGAGAVSMGCGRTG